MPARRTLPSSTTPTLSASPIFCTGSFLPLKKNADMRAATRKPGVRASAFKISSEMPSLKYLFSAFPLMFTNGSTAMDFWSVALAAAGAVGRALACGFAICLVACSD